MININLLPRHLRWVREPAHWRLLAILFPLIVGAALFLVHTVTQDSIAQLQTDVASTNDQLILLTPHVLEHQQLLQQQQQLNSLVSIANELSLGQVRWSSELLALLGHLPRNAAGELTVEFSSVSVRALNPPATNPDLYRGREYYTEFQVSGRALTYDSVTEFVRTIEASDTFGVQFHNAQRAGDTNSYTYSLTIVSLVQDGAL